MMEETRQEEKTPDPTGPDSEIKSQETSPEVAPLDATLYNRAIRFLARRPYGVEELRRRLERGGSDAEAVGKVIDRCLERGYLNDADFAESFARNRLINQCHGPARVRYDLRAVEVEERLVERAIQTVWEEQDQWQVARRALRKRYGFEAEREKLNQKDKKRRYDFLRRRGFDHDVVWDVLNLSE